MIIGSIDANLYKGRSESIAADNEKYVTASKNSVQDKDRVEISAQGYEKQKSAMCAASDEDALNISRSGKHSYVIHFKNSAVLSSVINKGYVTINGVDIQLSEEDKKQLAKMDELAQKERNQAAEKSTLAINAQAAKQQGEAMMDEAEEMGQVMLIASKMAAGIQVTAADEKFLMEHDPKLYAVAKSAGSLMKSRGREEKSISDASDDKAQNGQSAAEELGQAGAVKDFEITMNISLEGTPSIGSISIHEI